MRTLITILDGICMTLVASAIISAMVTTVLLIVAVPFAIAFGINEIWGAI